MGVVHDVLGLEVDTLGEALRGEEFGQDSFSPVSLQLAAVHEGVGQFIGALAGGVAVLEHVVHVLLHLGLQVYLLLVALLHLFLQVFHPVLQGAEDLLDILVALLRELLLACLEHVVGVTFDLGFHLADGLVEPLLEGFHGLGIPFGGLFLRFILRFHGVLQLGFQTGNLHLIVRFHLQPGLFIGLGNAGFDNASCHEESNEGGKDKPAKKSKKNLHICKDTNNSFGKLLSLGRYAPHHLASDFSVHSFSGMPGLSYISLLRIIYGNT